jgi:thymidylate synthase
VSKADQTYAGMLRQILRDGEVRKDRTGTGTIGVFGTQMRFDLAKEFPLLTTKSVFWKGVVHELLWFLQGSSNVKSLQEAGVHIWDEWANADGELGPVYGVQWRDWKGVASNGKSRRVDQIDELIVNLVENPFSRRHVVSAWNPLDLPDQKLPPCHCLFQFHVSNDNRLSCQLYQRSADMFLGVPFNIASYALLTHMIAHVTDLEVGELIWTGGDTHIYLNHREQVDEQLSRIGRPAPKLTLDRQVFNINHFGPEHIHLGSYVPHPPIKAKVSV